MGLNLGADDYIMKPYTVRNVIARVKSVLRRTAGHKGNTATAEKPNMLQVEGLQLDLEFKRCIVDGEEKFVGSAETRVSRVGLTA